MDADRIIEAARATLEGSQPFPQIVATLVSSGVEYYYVDYATKAFTFYDATGGTVQAPLSLDGLPPIAEALDVPVLVAAIRDSQRHGQAFPDFCRRAVAAGVQGYFAFLTGRRVTYLGRQGDSHTEWFPGAIPAKTSANIHPCLYYRDAPAAIAWLGRAFGFVERMSVPGENGRIEHSELTLGEGVIMVGSAKPDLGWVSPRDLPAANQGLSVFVEDPDAHYATAKAAGAEITRDLMDEEYGARGYGAKDIEGHHWYFGSYRPGDYWTT